MIFLQVIYQFLTHNGGRKLPKIFFYQNLIFNTILKFFKYTIVNLNLIIT
jgi:hypothetical protein